MNKTELKTSNAPAALGPYSQGVKTDSTVFVSGQIPINPATGAMPEGIEAQTRQSLTNIQSILAADGLTMQNVVKTTVLMQDLADFGRMNEVYAEFFSGVNPARAAFQVARLPKDALIEIEAIAVL